MTGGGTAFCTATVTDRSANIIRLSLTVQTVIHVTAYTWERVSIREGVALQISDSCNFVKIISGLEYNKKRNPLTHSSKWSAGCCWNRPCLAICKHRWNTAEMCRSLSHVPEVQEQRDPKTIELIRFFWVVKRNHATDLTQTRHLQSAINHLWWLVSH